MKISYLSSLEEIAEAHIRLYFRGKNCFRRRLIESFGMVIGIAGMMSIMINLATKTSLPIILLSPALVIGAYHYYRYPAYVRQRITNHIKQEIGNELPCETSYTIIEKQIIIKSLDTEIKFQIDSLRELKQDKYFVELWFGHRGLCVIPKRVFKSDGDLLGFINEFKME
jgi:hypothetical protein